MWNCRYLDEVSKGNPAPNFMWSDALLEKIEYVSLPFKYVPAAVSGVQDLSANCALM